MLNLYHKIHLLKNSNVSTNCNNLLGTDLLVLYSNDVDVAFIDSENLKKRHVDCQGDLYLTSQSFTNLMRIQEIYDLSALYSSLQ